MQRYSPVRLANRLIKNTHTYTHTYTGERKERGMEGGREEGRQREGSGEERERERGMEGGREEKERKLLFGVQTINKCCHVYLSNQYL